MTRYLPGMIAAFAIAALVALSGAGPALALDELKLEGTAFLDEELCAKDLQTKDCSLTIQVEGAAAKQLYDGLKVKAIQEECTGGMEKFDGSMLHCIKYEDGTYLCDFGYYFKEKSFGPGRTSC
ncbi:MAG: hypothetical protein LCH46_14700 [Proteobacteria bacterium]|nr:hypothetical protein [Pseudomonadota bacterium]